MRIAIYGAGSLGTVLGACLTKNGVPVDLVNRNRAHVEALRKNAVLRSAEKIAGICMDEAGIASAG